MTEDELREWVEAEYQLGELEQKPEWKTLIDVTASRIDAVQRAILGGSVMSMEKYKYETGRLAGMKEVLGIRQVVANMIQSERERRTEAAQGDA